MKRITDPTFCYTPSHATDIRETFARIRNEQANAKWREERDRERELRAVTSIGPYIEKRKP